MKKAFKIIVSVTLMVGLISCGEEVVVEEEVTKDPVEDFSDKMDEAIKEMDQITGDIEFLEGGEPIHYKYLQKFLPNSIDGYVSEDPEGTTLTMQGFSVSSAEAEYTSDNGDYVRVSILDYNAAMSVYQMSTAMWGMGITIDSDDEYAKSFTLNSEVNGWETFDKRNNKANVVAGIGNRLLITVVANNQTDTEKSKDILASMNLKSMVIVTNRD